MRPHTAIAAAATLLNDAAILPGGSHYPPQAQPSPRSGQWVWRSFQRFVIPTEQQLIVRPSCYLMAPKFSESVYDTAAVDPLVAAVMDFFDPAVSAEAYSLGTGTDRADYCHVAGGAAEPFLAWYAFRLDFEIGLTRFAGSP